MRKLLLCLGAVLFAASSASAQTVYRTSTGKHWFASAGTSENVVLSGIGTGDCIAVVFGWSVTTSTISSVAATGDTFTQVDTRSDGTSGTIATYYAKNAASGSTTITVTWSADPGFGELSAFAYSNCDTSAPLDVHTTNFQSNPATTTDAVTTGNVTTTANGDAVVGFVFDDSVNEAGYVLGTGYGHLTESGWSAGEDRIQSSAGAIPATFTAHQSFEHALTAILTLKAVSGGGASAATVSKPKKLCALEVTCGG